jgi:hypothetical protein
MPVVEPMEVLEGADETMEIEIEKAVSSEL